MKILVINGPNLNLLGSREPEIYGDLSLDEILAKLRERADAMGVELDCFQSNEEGALVTRIGETRGEFDGIIMNPAGYTHSSVALRDALQASNVPCVEVHLSNIHSREEFRRTSMTAPACIGSISGFGATSYILALEALVDHMAKRG